MSRFIRLLFSSIAAWLLTSSVAFAADDKKQIDFEGDVVEGVNKQPLDSLNQISDGDGGKHRFHLYRRKKPVGTVRTENKETVRELAETY